MRDANIAADHARYPWDEWKVREYYTDVDERMFDRLDRLSSRATIGLSIACAEWICHRLSKLDSDPAPLQFLEAAWAGVVSSAYCVYTETNDDDWRGPVRGPLNMTIAIVNDALFCLSEDPHGATRACWMYNLAKHVLPDTDAFERWFETIVKRLEKYCPKPPEDEEDMFVEIAGMGDPIPRDLFDPDLPPDSYRRVGAIDRYLNSLDPSRNPFLVPAADIQGVEGVGDPPYSYFGL